MIKIVELEYKYPISKHNDKGEFGIHHACYRSRREVLNPNHNQD